MKKKQFRWVIATLIVILFAVTAPKNINDFGHDNPRLYKVDNYFVFSTCSASYQAGTKWKVHYVGVLGMKIKVRAK